MMTAPVDGVASCAIDRTLGFSISIETMNMPNWIRTCSLIVSGNKTLDLSDLRVRFAIRQGTLQTPHTAEITVTNPADATAKALLANEYTNVTLSAGYKDSSGIIFNGTIKQCIKGREGQQFTDTFVTIYASTGDRPYNFAHVNTTLPKGSSQQDIFQACIKAMKPFGISSGQSPQSLSQMKYPRAIPLFGMARDYLRLVAQSSQASWFFTNNNSVLMLLDSDPGTGAIILNSETGMIGQPRQTQGGIIVTALINPNFRVGGQVTIDQGSIVRAAPNLNIDGEPSNALLANQGLTDGTYRILAIDWEGDTRGQPWYAHITCIGAITGVIPPTQAQQGRV